MFEGRYTLALGPGGALMLPEKVRKEMHSLWGENPPLLCFGAQFLYICREEQAEPLLARVDRQLCAAFSEDLSVVNDYLERMAESVARLQPGLNGEFTLPRKLMAFLNAPRGGRLALLGVDDHLELWNTERLDAQSALLERQVQARSPLRGAPRPQSLWGGSPEDTPICLQSGEHPCSLLKGGLPVPRRCGPCVWLRLA